MIAKILSVIFIVFFLLFGVFYYTFASTVIFSDSFDDKSVGFSGWRLDPEITKWKITSGGSTIRYSGTGRADVVGPTATEKGQGYSELNILTKNISTSGYGDITLSFWYLIPKGKSLKEDDHVYVEWSPDGSNWNLLDNFTNLVESTNWQKKSYVLPSSAGNNANFLIRFKAFLNVSTRAFYLDDVVLSGDDQGVESTPASSLEPTITPIPMFSVTPTPILSTTKTPTPTTSVSKTPTPSPLITSSKTPHITFTPNPSSTPVPSVSIVPKSTPSLSVQAYAEEPTQKSNTDLAEESEKDTEDSSALSASISGITSSKALWLLGPLVLVVVLSLGKFNKKA